MRGFGQLVGHTPKGNAKSRCRFDSDFVVHGRVRHGWAPPRDRRHDAKRGTISEESMTLDL
jgi:hypothetical protein